MLINGLEVLYFDILCHNVIQGQDLKVIKCTGRAKFVNKILFSDQCIHRLLFGFVWSGSLYNLHVNA